MTGYAIAEKTAPRMICSGSAIRMGRHWTLSDAQNDTSSMGSSSRCCNSRVSQLANTMTLVTRAMPALML